MLRFYYCLLLKKFIWVYIVLCDIYIYIYIPVHTPILFFKTSFLYIYLLWFLGLFLLSYCVTHMSFMLYKNLEITHGRKHRIFVFMVWLSHGLTYLTWVSPIASIFMHMMWLHSSSKLRRIPPCIQVYLLFSTHLSGVGVWSWNLRWFHSSVIVNRGSVSTGMWVSL